MQLQKTRLGNALKNSKSHPWGKGATEKYTAEELVKIGRAEGYSYKSLFKKLEAIANITEDNHPITSKKWRKAAQIAHMLAQAARSL